MDPDELVKLSPGEASRLVQEFIDSLSDGGCSVRYVNVSLAYLKAFFKVNGFKGERSLEVESHYQPSRYRKRGEYVPTRVRSTGWPMRLAQPVIRRLS